MEDNVLPPFYTLLTQLLPDHVQRNRRILKLLSSSHDEMVDAEEAVLLLSIYRRFMEVLLLNNADPLLTERIKDAFITAVADVGATLGTANTAGFRESHNGPITTTIGRRQCESRNPAEAGGESSTG